MSDAKTVDVRLSIDELRLIEHGLGLAETQFEMESEQSNYFSVQDEYRRLSNSSKMLKEKIIRITDPPF